jgi:hypothetical protein
LVQKSVAPQSIAGRDAENIRRRKWIPSIPTPHITALAAGDYLRSGGFDRHRRPFADKIPESSRSLESDHRDRDN